MRKNLKKSPRMHSRNYSNITSSRNLNLTPHRPSLSSLTDHHPHNHSVQDHFDLAISSPRSSIFLNHEVKRPISLSILEKYFSDICQCITNKDYIEPALLVKVETMKEVLKDCVTSVNNLSLEIYILMSSALKDVNYVQNTADTRIFNALLNKLMKIAVLIEDDKYRNRDEPAFKGFGDQEEENSEPWVDLDIKLTRVTARVLNIWKKIVSPQKEGGIICCCFLLLYCEVDRSIKVSPSLRIKYDKAVNLMKDYSANPGYVVTVLRKTREYIEKEMISPEVMRRINEALSKISPESVKSVDKTFTGLVIYEMLVSAVKFYHFFYSKKFGINILEKTQRETRPQFSDLNEKNFGISQSENFGIILSVDSPKNKNSSRPSLSPHKSSNSAIPLNPIPKTLTNSPLKSSIIHLTAKPSPLKTPKKVNFPVSNTQTTKSVKKKIETSTKKFSDDRKEKSLSPMNKKIMNESVDHSDLLEEMQYQQFIEEKFRNFLVAKLNGFEKEDSLEGKIKSEEMVIKNREGWMKEFENKVGVIRFNAIKKLSGERRFMAELIRAQKHLEVIESKVRFD